MQLRNPGARPTPPLLASVHVGSGGPFSFYLRNQARTSHEVGIAFRDVTLPEGTGTTELQRQVQALDKDPSVHAVLIQHPLPDGVDFRGAVDALSPEKDVDGVGTVNLGRIVAQKAVHAPAVALAVLQILRHYSIPIRNRRVAIIGRSSTVGLPLALLMAGRGASADATVTIAHSRTPRLSESLVGNDIIVSCAGVPGLLDRTVVPKGAIVVDVGLSSVPDDSTPSGSRATGDANATSLDGWAEAVTPVPGGVGPVTVAQLMLNVVAAWKLQAGGLP
ncbi:MAG: bifunctional 5,10-methylenetetrahydrofolate dehydrogenase/5,10-methenyltetrahydrofolate cyclohydrolase [Thermoplasmata archaeon]|nr:bifunctional 5,10-methylenetetrahydrofolate dehydrogenase/5,10-methenyltetrahydrofolate cyclohydrolase [Thermoplasmata archaeon]